MRKHTGIRQINPLFILLMWLVSVACTSTGKTAGKGEQYHQSLYIEENDLLLSGYNEKISGSDFSYSTAVPGVDETLIVRATDGQRDMVWETETAPEAIDAEYVSFVWAANIHRTDQQIPLTLTIDGDEKIEFRLSRDPEWSVQGSGGVRLFYKENRRTNHDSFGFMVLRVPGGEVTAGEPLRLRVQAEDAGSSAGYMTVKTPVEQDLQVQGYPALLNMDGELVQPVSVDLFYFGEPGKTSLSLGSETSKTVDASFGHSQFKMHAKSRQLEAEARVPDGTISTEVLIDPIREWNMHFVQNTHTDIGYTRPQTEIMSDLIRHLDLALDLMDDTDHLPEASQFRWTAEVTWPVDQFLKNRTSEQIERLRKRVEEGRLELAGMYLNFDELPDEQALARSLKPIDRIREHDLDFKTAMQNDVNGIGWAFNDYFNSLGIRYLTMGTHGHKALVPFDHPTAFWWESPSGKRMLAFRGEHYHIGNTRFQISRQDFDHFEREVLAYLNELEDREYPFDIIMIQHSGYLTDNSPPSKRPSEMIRKWNEKYEWPKMRFSVISNFFEDIEEEHADELPVYRGAWPDWWVDGFGSGAREMATTRQGHVDIIAGQSVLSMAGLLGYDIPEHSRNQINLANEALLFYGEHTFGSHASVREPYGKETKEMRRLKESFAWEASRRTKLVQEDALGLLQAQISKLDKNSIVIYNPLPRIRSGVTTVFIDNETVPGGSDVQLRDDEGRIYPAQLQRTIHGGSYWAFRVKDIPSFGFRQFEIILQDSGESKSGDSDHQYTLENDWYQLKVDSERAVVTSLYDKELDKELVDDQADWGFGQFIYERLADRNQLDRFYLDDYERRPLDSVQFDGFEQGDIWDTMRFIGATEAAIGDDGVTMEIRLHHADKQIDFHFNIRKKPIVDPEGIYIAFPFAMDDGEIFFDVPGGMIQAGVDQIPGSSNDWNMVQNVAMVKNSESAVMMTAHEAPLMQMGNINTGRFEAGAEPDNTHIYGWPMNNYWVTNFNADQKGEFEWTYNITSGSKTSFSTAMNFAWKNRMPLLPRVFPSDEEADAEPASISLISEFPDNVHLVSLTPHDDGQNLMLHIRETDGKQVRFNPDFFDFKRVKYAETDVNGNRTEAEEVSEITLAPFESRFFEVQLE